MYLCNATVISSTYRRVAFHDRFLQIVFAGRFADQRQKTWCQKFGCEYCLKFSTSFLFQDPFRDVRDGFLYSRSKSKKSALLCCTFFSDVKYNRNGVCSLYNGNGLGFFSHHFRRLVFFLFSVSLGSSCPLECGPTDIIVNSTLLGVVSMFLSMSLFLRFMVVWCNLNGYSDCAMLYSLSRSGKKFINKNQLFSIVVFLNHWATASSAFFCVYMAGTGSWYTIT